MKRIGPLKLTPDEIERFVLRFEDLKLRWWNRLVLAGILPLPKMKRKRGETRPKP